MIETHEQYKNAKALRRHLSKYIQSQSNGGDVLKAWFDYIQNDIAEHECRLKGESDWLKKKELEYGQE